MINLSTTDLQRVCDCYSVGRVQGINRTVEKVVNYKKWKVGFTGLDFYSNKGSYQLYFAKNKEVHQIWWANEKKDFETILRNKLDIPPSLFLLESEGNYTVHKFGVRFVLFEKSRSPANKQSS